MFYPKYQTCPEPNVVHGPVRYPLHAISTRYPLYANKYAKQNQFSEKSNGRN